MRHLTHDEHHQHRRRAARPVIARLVEHGDIACAQDADTAAKALRTYAATMRGAATGIAQARASLAALEADLAALDSAEPMAAARSQDIKTRIEHLRTIVSGSAAHAATVETTLRTLDQLSKGARS